MRGKDLSATLERLGMSQTKIGEVLGYRAETINRMVRGKQEIPRSVAIAARVLDLVPYLRERLEDQRTQHRGAWLEGYETAIRDVAAIFEEEQEFRYSTTAPPPPLRRPPLSYGQRTGSAPRD